MVGPSRIFPIAPYYYSEYTLRECVICGHKQTFSTKLLRYNAPLYGFCDRCNKQREWKEVCKDQLKN